MVEVALCKTERVNVILDVIQSHLLSRVSLCGFLLGVPTYHVNILSAFMLSVDMLSALMVIGLMLDVIMLRTAILSAIFLNVVMLIS